MLGKQTKAAYFFLDSDVSSPLHALSKLVPVPESLMSPDYRPSPLLGRIGQPSTIPTSVVHRTTSKLIQPTNSPKSSKSNLTKLKICKPESKKNSPAQQRKLLQSNQYVLNM